MGVVPFAERHSVERSRAANGRRYQKTYKTAYGMANQIAISAGQATPNVMMIHGIQGRSISRIGSAPAITMGGHVGTPDSVGQLSTGIEVLIRTVQSRIEACTRRRMLRGAPLRRGPPRRRAGGQLERRDGPRHRHGDPKGGSGARRDG
jgi:hypothetical protein